PHGPYAAGTVPTTADAAAAALEPGGAGVAVRAGARGRGDARPGARSRPAAAHGGGVRRRGDGGGHGGVDRIRSQDRPAGRAEACGPTPRRIVVVDTTTIHPCLQRVTCGDASRTPCGSGRSFMEPSSSLP